MANPRKFSEKIALHNQKQAEETAAFEAILRDVSAATRGHAQQKQTQQLHIQQNIMQQFRGGSLPNVNQMVHANSGLDMQSVQQMDNLRGSQQSRIDRMHQRDRGRQQIGPGPLRSRPFTMEKSRADCAPYGSGAYLSPPPDSGWRRTNSDSAIHASSSMGSGRPAGDVQSPNTPPMHRRIHEVVGENSGLSAGPYSWDPKKLQQRPKSCEVPNINIYPSGEQDSQMHIPISNNTGSLPDLTILQFPSPLTTPIDGDDQNYNNNPANLSPTSAHHLSHSQHHNGSPVQSPGSQRRRMNPSGPSPLVLPGNGSQTLPLSPPVPNIDPSRLQMDPRIRQQYMLYMQQQQQRHGPVHDHMSPTQSSHTQSGLGESPRVPPPHLGPVPKVCVTHENDPPEPSLTQYRTNISENSACQSPTSPHSQTYSPSQSPGLPPTTWNNSNSVFELDPYHLQQQQTNALQQQFDHFNLHQANSVCSDVSTSAGVILTSTASNSLSYSHDNQALSPDYSRQQFYVDSNNTSQSHSLNNISSSSTANNKIPDIILSGMAESIFDSDLFSGVSDEALKDGLVPLDPDGLQMLTDPNLVTDADTENSFRLDQL
ncbi:CREB-regulated transcription coactivator 1 [Mactra antiquata]